MRRRAIPVTVAALAAATALAAGCGDEGPTQAPREAAAAAAAARVRAADEAAVQTTVERYLGAMSGDPPDGRTICALVTPDSRRRIASSMPGLLFRVVPRARRDCETGALFMAAYRQGFYGGWRGRVVRVTVAGDRGSAVVEMRTRRSFLGRRSGTTAIAVHRLGEGWRVVQRGRGRHSAR